jgi:hypothetical protein
VVSHISRRTSEIPEFPVRSPIQRSRVLFSLGKRQEASRSPPIPTGNSGVWGTRRSVVGTDQVRGLYVEQGLVEICVGTGTTSEAVIGTKVFSAAKLSVAAA